MTNTTKKMTRAELEAEIERLKAEKSSIVAMKVSQKGAVSVYGMGRFPVTLYKAQWERLLNAKEDILNFIEKNSNSLAVKSLILGLFFMASTVTQAGITLRDYKNGRGSLNDYSVSYVEKTFNSSTPVCIKDGAKLIGVNNAFVDGGYGYRDCSRSAKNLHKQRKLGYKIIVLDYALLPASILKSFTTKK